mgnify:FL=1
MVDPTPVRRPVDLQRTSLRTDEAEREIRLRVADTHKVQFTLHAFDRAEEREEQEILNTEDALDILRTGFVMSAPEKARSGWKCKVVKNILGNRDAGVVTIIVLESGKLRVLTVEWED